MLCVLVDSTQITAGDQQRWTNEVVGKVVNTYRRHGRIGPRLGRILVVGGFTTGGDLAQTLVPRVSSTTRLRRDVVSVGTADRRRAGSEYRKW